MNRIRVYVFTTWQCLRSIFKINLGDKVYWNFDHWTVVNGVSKPIWDLQNETGTRVRIHEDEFVKLWSIANAKHDVKQTWNFYRGYWFEIWFKNPHMIRSY